MSRRPKQKPSRESDESAVERPTQSPPKERKSNNNSSKPALDELTDLMERLRGPEGCPWDREQTLTSLVPFIIEEAYEVVSAIEEGTAERVKEELGDLLFQIVFVCQIAREQGEFEIEDVIRGTVAKMIRRHPHVFGQARADTSAEVLRRWESIKEAEKIKDGCKTGFLADVPESFPALLRAHKVSEKAARVGFDWENMEQVLGKVEEEIEEFRQAIKLKDSDAARDEFGDILFALANIGRFIEVNPEEALRKTIGKFINRFHYIEKELESEGKTLASTPIEEMERLWNEAKQNRKDD